MRDGEAGPVCRRPRSPPGWFGGDRRVSRAMGFSDPSVGVHARRWARSVAIDGVSVAPACVGHAWGRAGCVSRPPASVA